MFQYQKWLNLSNETSFSLQESIIFVKHINGMISWKSRTDVRSGIKNSNAYINLTECKITWYITRWKHTSLFFSVAKVHCNRRRQNWATGFLSIPAILPKNVDLTATRKKTDIKNNDPTYFYSKWKRQHYKVWWSFYVPWSKK